MTDPLDQSSGATPARGTAPPALPRARILVVDDERFFREAIRETLEGAGFAVATASNGFEALELATDPEVAVVVLDVQMPGMNGIEVLRRLREARPSLRVLILSAHTDQEVVLEALRLGACDYLAKPLHDEELVLAVRRALETFAFAAAWDGLRSRLAALEGKLGELARGADEGDTASPETLGARAANAAADLLGAGKTSLLLVDPDGSRLRVTGVSGHKVPITEMDPVPVGEGVAGSVFSKGQGVVVKEVATDPRFARRAEPQRYASGSFAVAPVAAGERILGVLCATDRDGGAPFDETDLALLRVLAAQVGMLLQPRIAAPPAPASAAAPEEDLDETLPETLASVAPAPEELERDAELARSVCEAVSAEVEPARVLDAALRPIAAVLEAAPVSLYLRDPEQGDLACEGQVDAGRAADRARLPLGRGLTGAVLATGVLVASPQPEADPRFDAEVDTPASGAASPLLCLPVRFRGKNLGVLRAFLPAGATPSARTGEVLTAAVSAAVRNVFLYRSLVDSIEEVARARREEGDPV